MALRASAVAGLAWLATLLVAATAAARTEGPFTARIVDAETGKPVAGVVVVALYRKKTPAFVHPSTEFFDLDETVSDADGRLAFTARDLPASTPLLHVVGPEMIIFKAGYKGWRFQGVDSRLGVDPVVRDRAYETAWQSFRSSGVVIELTPAKTRDDRGLAFGRANRFPPIPEGRAPHLRRALDEELYATQKPR